MTVLGKGREAKLALEKKKNEELELEILKLREKMKEGKQFLTPVNQPSGATENIANDGSAEMKSHNSF